MKLYEIFDSVACSRCGGNPAAWSRFGHVANGKCLKCGGGLFNFTKHGRRDYDRWRAAVDALTVKPLAELKVGDHVRVGDMPRYVEVVAIGAPHANSWTIRDGVRHENLVVDITLAREIFFPSMLPGIPGYKSAEVQAQAGPGATVRIWPGSPLPAPQDYVTPKKPRPAPPIAPGALMAVAHGI